MKKLLVLALAALMVLSVLAGCKPADKTNGTTGTTAPTERPQLPALTKVEKDPADAVAHSSFESVYDVIGSKVTIDMVTEDENGLAWVTVDGKKYELGMDFLSMAMVYNCTPAGDFATADDVYNEWWKLYIQRWNYLVPEVPLYSNQYFDLYNAKLDGFVTSPYWGAADAIVAATVKAGNANSVILGSATQLSGAFRNSSWGKSSPGASDLDIQNLTSGHATMESNMEGAYVWNMNTLAAEPTSVVNEDGTLTYTIKIKEGLVFSDGSAISAKHYIASVLANSTEVVMAAGGTGNSGMNFVGYDEFKAYTGDNADAEGVSKTFSGIKLLDDYTFSVTIQKDYANYYYATTYAAFSPNPLALYLGDNDIVVAEDKSCGLSDGFYKKVNKDGTETYAMADVIVANLKWNSKLPYSGPYTVANYDESTLTATLKLNPNYTSDVRGKATIETITYIEVVTETQMDMFKTGQVDVIAGITGATETEAALALVKESPDKYAETHYDRAGYGKLAFRCDLGPTNFTAVRQAIIYTINRPEFAQTFTGGYGAVVDGPFYTGNSAYLANKDSIILNNYAYSKDSAIEALEAGGWIYNDKGQYYTAGTDAVRYKKLEGYELTLANINYKSTDGKYETLKLSDGNYYMPLAINWYGTQPNEVTDQLITAWQTNPNATTEIGAYITYTSCDFTSGLYGEYLQIAQYGWDGVAKCAAINFATGFNSAIYDQAYYWTINPEYYADYSNNYLMDEADFAENYK